MRRLSIIPNINVPSNTWFHITNKYLDPKTLRIVLNVPSKKVIEQKRTKYLKMLNLNVHLLFIPHIFEMKRRM